MTISTDELKALIQGKQVLDLDSEDQDFRHGLRLVLRDLETGELGLLAVEPFARPDEEGELLTYSYQSIETELRSYPECLIEDLRTKVEPDFLPGEVPFLF